MLMSGSSIQWKPVDHSDWWLLATSQLLSLAVTITQDRLRHYQDHHDHDLDDHDDHNNYYS